MNCKPPYLTPRQRITVMLYFVHQLKKSFINYMNNTVFDFDNEEQQRLAWWRYTSYVTLGEFFDDELSLDSDDQLHIHAGNNDLIYNDDTCDELTSLFELCKTAVWYSIVGSDDKEKD